MVLWCCRYGTRRESIGTLELLRAIKRAVRLFCVHSSIIAAVQSRLTIAMTLIRMFISGPEVSLNGSPTVSPTTAAACVSEPFPPRLPSTYS